RRHERRQERARDPGRDHRLSFGQHTAQRLGDDLEDVLRKRHETQEHDEHREHRLHDARAKLDEMRDQGAFGELLLLLIVRDAAHPALLDLRISSFSATSTAASTASSPCRDLPPAAQLEPPSPSAGRRGEVRTGEPDSFTDSASAAVVVGAAGSTAADAPCGADSSGDAVPPAPALVAADSAGVDDESEADFASAVAESPLFAAPARGFFFCAL